MPLPKQDNEYTYEDYLKWDEKERIEIIDGLAYMHAAPSTAHQSASGEFVIQIGGFLKGKPCKVFAAPFCVKLNDRNVVEPDIVIICDKSKLGKRGYDGAPEMIIEILSPSTAKIDKIAKFNKYEEAGVKEYWIVEPNYKMVSVFMLQENGRYGRPNSYTDEDKVRIGVFPECEIDLSLIFDF